MAVAHVDAALKMVDGMLDGAGATSSPGEAAARASVFARTVHTPATSQCGALASCLILLHATVSFIQSCCLSHVLGGGAALSSHALLGSVFLIGFAVLDWVRFS